MNAKEIRIDNTLVSAKARGRIIHLLDLDLGMSLTNALGKNFCHKVLDSLKQTGFGDIPDYTFVCYHTDNTISIFYPEDSTFEFLHLDDERVDSEFKREMYYLYGC